MSHFLCPGLLSSTPQLCSNKGALRYVIGGDLITLKKIKQEKVEKCRFSIDLRWINMIRCTNVCLLCDILHGLSSPLLGKEDLGLLSLKSPLELAVLISSGLKSFVACFHLPPSRYPHTTMIYMCIRRTTSFGCFLTILVFNSL